MSAQAYHADTVGRFMLVSASGTPLFNFWRFLPLLLTLGAFTKIQQCEVFLKPLSRNTNALYLALIPRATLQRHVILRNDHIKVVIVQNYAKSGMGVSYNIQKRVMHFMFVQELVV